MRTALVNQYYWYGMDADFGPFFLKFSSYFPCNAKFCCNGHEYAKKQLETPGDRLPSQPTPPVRRNHQP